MKGFVVVAVLLTALAVQCASQGQNQFLSEQRENGENNTTVEFIKQNFLQQGKGNLMRIWLQRKAGMVEGHAPPRNTSIHRRAARKRSDMVRSINISGHPNGTNGSVPRKIKKRLNSTANYCYNKRYKLKTVTGNEWRSELEKAAMKFNRNNSIVLTGGDWTYRATVLNWMAHAENIGMTQYIVLCYGERMYNLVGSWEEGGHGILVRDCTRVIEYMFMKIVGMFHLHDMRYIVTWSDCDALWLKPFMDTWILPYQRTSDVLSQKALHPITISNKTGSVICTGLFTVFPSARSMRAMKLLIQVVRSYRQASDQLLVNKYLGRLGAFNFNTRVEFDDEDMAQVVAMPRYRNASSLRLGFLPSGVFPRSRSEREWAYVQKHDPALWHSKTDKAGQSKISGMKNASVFALKDGWENLVNASEVPPFIDIDLLRSRRWRNIATIKNITGAVEKGAK